MLELLLIRHGETEWNATGRYQGHTDVALSDLGMVQAKAAGRRLSKQVIDSIYCSDLRRARDTALAIASEAALRPVIVEDPRWREIDVGQLSGLNREEANHLGVYRLLHSESDRYPGGESQKELRARVSEALQYVRQRHLRGRIAIVAHGGSIKAAVNVLLNGASVSASAGFAAVGNTAISRFVLADAGALLSTYNDAAHLEDPVAITRC